MHDLRGGMISINEQNNTVHVLILLDLKGTWQCCGTVTIYYGSGSDF